ncbi:MAG TPA: MOSC domain-containing protein, partial [Syntrophorhabdaceae bacterium]|nr:MOSC domain-containing protein [Syntrophorhabdaceae bacterium]
KKDHSHSPTDLLKDKGLMGDAHAGFMHRQVSLLARESIDKIRSKGLDVNAGDFAENLTTEGIVLHELPVGTSLKTTGGVLLRVTQIGKECHTRCNIFQTVGDCVMPREGIFAEVLTEGDVSVGDELEVIA